MSLALQILLEFLAAGVGTVSFALLFQVPAAYYLRCGLIGGWGWLCYRLLALAGLSPMPATFLACTAVAFCSRLSAVRRRCPVTVFLIPGIFPLVPGVGIYWTAYYLVVDAPALAAQRGALTLKVAVAIVLAILLVFELPQSVFSALCGRQNKSK